VFDGFGSQFNKAAFFGTTEVLNCDLFFESCSVVPKFAKNTFHFHEVTEVEKGSNAVITFEGIGVNFWEFGGAAGERFFECL